MSALRRSDQNLPGRFMEMVHLMPPQAIQNDTQYESTSKIPRGERSLTMDHVRKLCERFMVNPRLFVD